MNPITISESIPLLLMDGNPLTGFLHYKQRDPCVVRLDVPGFIDEIHILRDSLCAGQNRLIDDKYIEMQPDADYPDWIKITLRAPRPEPLVLWVERKSLGSAVARTFQVVPRESQLP